MDRCRCEEYAAAVEKLKFYTVGTIRPDILENYSRSDFAVKWVSNGVNVADLQFTKPKAYKIKQIDPKKQEREEVTKIKKMWCPYMTPVRR